MYKEDIRPTINKLSIKYVKCNPEFDFLDLTQMIDACNIILKQLPHRLQSYDSQFITVVDENGNKQQKEQPVFYKFDNFSNSMHEFAQKCLSNACVNKPLPTVKFDNKANLRKFLIALKKLFPNVQNVKQTFNSVLKWRKAFEDEDEQWALYLYSARSGGTGKSYLTNAIKKYFKNNNYKVAHLTDCNYLSPDKIRTNLLVVNDFAPDKVDIEEFNKIIDRDVINYNIKYGPKGETKATANVIISSNYKPQNKNSRRWAYVDYINYNMQDYDGLSEEEMQSYIKDLFECAPLDFSEIKDNQPKAFSYEVCQFIVDHKEAAPSTPTKFINNFCVDYNREKLLNQLGNMFTDWKSLRQFPQKWNTTPFKQMQFNWGKIAEYIIDNKLVDVNDIDKEQDTDIDILDYVAKQWDNLIEELCCSPNNPNNDKPKAEDDEFLKANKVDNTIDDSISDDELNEIIKNFDNQQVYITADNKAITYDNKAPLRPNWRRINNQPITIYDKTEEIYPIIMPFEADTCSLEEQEDNVIDKNVFKERVFSGNKSYHYILEIPEEIQNIFKKDEDDNKNALYTALYKEIAKQLFKNTNLLDKADSTLRRVTRNPNGVRIINNKEVIQTVENLSNNNLPIETWRKCLGIAKFQTSCAIHKLNEIKLCWKNPGKNANCQNMPSVKRYLETPYPKKNGNGTSNHDLYTAIFTCKLYNDDIIFNNVCQKALAESWTHKEIQSKIRNAEKEIAKLRLKI